MKSPPVQLALKRMHRKNGRRHLPDGGQARDHAPLLAPALRLRLLGLDGFDLPVGMGAVLLDDVAAVLEASPEQVDQERLRVAMEHPAGPHGAVSPPVVVADGGATLRRAAPAARVTACAPPLPDALAPHGGTATDEWRVTGTAARLRA